MKSIGYYTISVTKKEIQWELNRHEYESEAFVSYLRRFNIHYAPEEITFSEFKTVYHVYLPKPDPRFKKIYNKGYFKK